jgi:hypothetical protein
MSHRSPGAVSGLLEQPQKTVVVAGHVSGETACTVIVRARILIIAKCPP